MRYGGCAVFESIPGIRLAILRLGRLKSMRSMARLRLVMMACAALLLGAVPLAVHAQSAYTESVGGSPRGEVIATVSGKVEGFVRSGVLEFRGIPYAATVSGEARWTLPKPVSPWLGVLPAMHFGKACPQAARYGLTERSDEEDCLTLNITLPRGKSTRPRPVLLWIHGGAFVGGSASLYRLDRLARDANAVVVSINYRLGVFGFMAPPAAASGTKHVLALEDQRLAMRWVKDNIAAFGGDPSNITLAGESAGAASVCMHMHAPELTRGLFHRAIVQSAACSTPLRNLAEAEAFAVNVAAEVGCADPKTTLACLKAIEPQRLIAAGTKAAQTDLRAFAPFAGSVTVPRGTLDALQDGAFARVPVLNGFTRDEMRLYVGYDVQNGATITPETYRLAVRRIYGDKADQVLSAYPLKSGERAPETLGSLMTDFMPGLGITHCLMLESGRLLARHVPVYQWEYADRTAPVRGVSIPILPDPGFVLGAVHSAELNALFPNFSNTSAISAPDLSPASQRLADRIVRTWSTFMRAGRPDGNWAHGKRNMPAAAVAVMRFEPGAIHPFDAWAEYKCEFWRSAFPAYFGAVETRSHPDTGPAKQAVKKRDI